MGSNPREETIFIETDDGTIYVPRPTSVFAGWARHIWMTEYFKRKVFIASPPLWETLCEQYTPRALR